MRLTAHGIRAELPDGWEGRIRRESPPPSPPGGGRRPFASTHVPAVPYPVAHLATFALPGGAGDFGGGATFLMRTTDVFVSLLEYDPSLATTPLFSPQGLPRRLDPRAFSPRSLQRHIPGQAGWQTFFSEGGRAFCLYVVLGDADDRHRLVRTVETVLAGVHIEPLAAVDEEGA